MHCYCLLWPSFWIARFWQWLGALPIQVHRTCVELARPILILMPRNMGVYFLVQGGPSIRKWRENWQSYSYFLDFVAKSAIIQMLLFFCGPFHIPFIGISLGPFYPDSKISFLKKKEIKNILKNREMFVTYFVQEIFLYNFSSLILFVNHAPCQVNRSKRLNKDSHAKKSGKPPKYQIIIIFNKQKS